MESEFESRATTLETPPSIENDFNAGIPLLETPGRDIKSSEINLDSSEIAAKGVDFDLSAREGAGEELIKDHPLVILRAISEGLFTSLEDLINGCLRRPAEMGFHATTVKTVYVEDVLGACHTVIQATAPMVRFAAADPVAVAAQKYAKLLRGLAQTISGFLIHSDLLGGVPEPAMSMVLQNSINFQKHAANCMNDVTNIMMGVLAIPVEIEEEDSEQDDS